MKTAKISGHWGEAMAAEYLRKKRYEIIACNYHTRFGEIDLIARDRKTVVFVEVKIVLVKAFAHREKYLRSVPGNVGIANRPVGRFH